MKKNRNLSSCIYNRVKELRIEKGLTQDVLAKKIKSDRSYIAFIENNKFRPSVDVALKISKALGRPPHEIWYLDFTQSISNP